LISDLQLFHNHCFEIFSNVLYDDTFVSVFYILFLFKTVIFVYGVVYLSAF